MAEKQILSLKPAPRLEQVGNEHSERVQDRKHPLNDAMILPHDPNPGRMEFSERTEIQYRDGLILCFLVKYAGAASPP
jgi:hypothetical protein